MQRVQEAVKKTSNKVTFLVPKLVTHLPEETYELENIIGNFFALERHFLFQISLHSKRLLFCSNVTPETTNLRFLTPHCALCIDKQ